MAEKAKVFVVDDHPIARLGLIQLINQEPDFITCGEAEDAPRALSRMEKTQPDIAVIDISLKGTNGIELIKSMKPRYPDMKILVMSMHDESLYAERALRAGAHGYIMKQEAVGKVIDALRSVLSGQIYLSDKMSDRMLHRIVGGQRDVKDPVSDRLSDRELEVFQLIGQGLGTSTIAAKLNLSVKTIETYRAGIKEKLKLGNASELVQYAIGWAKKESH